MLPKQFELHVLTSIGPRHLFLARLRRRVRLDKVNPKTGGGGVAKSWVAIGSLSVSAGRNSRSSSHRVHCLVSDPLLVVCVSEKNVAPAGQDKAVPASTCEQIDCLLIGVNGALGIARLKRKPSAELRQVRAIILVKFVRQSSLVLGPRDERFTLLRLLRSNERFRVLNFGNGISRIVSSRSSLKIFGAGAVALCIAGILAVATAITCHTSGSILAPITIWRLNRRASPIACAWR
jgi:hypothetical protein